MSSDFDALQPQTILDAIDRAGYLTTGEISQLNSYENRVFDIRLEKSSKAPDPVERVIAKFYRPRRWSEAAVKDEHDFLHDLASEGIPAVPPLLLSNGQTTFTYQGYVMALFPRVYGRMPDEFLSGQLKQVGRTLARIHNVGARRVAKHRPHLTVANYGWPALERLERHVYPELWRRYEEICMQILEEIEEQLEEASHLRIHGDCHKGNLLQSASGDRDFIFVDFDDFCNGPVVQDFWMLLSGGEGDDDAEAERDEIVAGYEELREVPDEWHLFGPLRALRIIHYAGWIAQRWNDPFFQRIFPEFQTYNYWLDELTRLEKIADEF
ncbi:MAG: serine/threonine protein kinase [Bdellovibrionota bacterium]